MYRLGQVELVYLHQSEDSNYNPVIEEHRVLVKCTLMDTFSVNYYLNQSREMKNSKNIIVPKTYCNDVIIGSKRYQLEYANFGTRKYKIVNVLNNRDSSLTSILDTEEVINE